MDLILKLWRGLCSRAQIVILKSCGATIHGHVWLRSVDIPHNPWDIELGNGVALDRGVSLIAVGESTGSSRIKIGARTYINRYSIIDATEKIEIGADCMLGPHCYVTDHDHNISGGNRKSELPATATTLHDNVWLGAHVTVLKGVSIGTGSVIGAGSVVTRSIPENCLAIGSPARVIRSLAKQST